MSSVYEKDLYQELVLAKQKGLLASVLKIEDVIRIRFKNDESYETKQDKLRDYIIRTYKHIEKISVCGVMMFLYIRS